MSGTKLSFRELVSLGLKPGDAWGEEKRALEKELDRYDRVAPSYASYGALLGAANALNGPPRTLRPQFCTQTQASANLRLALSHPHPSALRRRRAISSFQPRTRNTPRLSVSSASPKNESHRQTQAPRPAFLVHHHSLLVLCGSICAPSVHAVALPQHPPTNAGQQIYAKKNDYADLPRPPTCTQLVPTRRLEIRDIAGGRDDCTIEVKNDATTSALTPQPHDPSSTGHLRRVRLVTNKRASRSPRHLDYSTWHPLDAITLRFRAFLQPRLLSNVAGRPSRSQCLGGIWVGISSALRLSTNAAARRSTLYKRSDEEKLLRGKPLDAVIAACIFIACRQAHVPRTFREICNLTHVSKKLLGQCYKALEQAFNLNPGASATASTPGVTTGPENMLARYCNHLDLPQNVQAVCKDVIIAAREHGIADGRSPVSIAGGAIYFTCNLLGVSKALKDISAVAGVSEGTIKLVYKLYHADKEKLVKQEWIDSGKADLERLPFVNT
ncbi:hypothetical protein HMN09_01160300 [Mycena chlorophos]|uniref:Transcription initiation factor IIB n=1 Tax=Mycena chlorophos TaxID=658473 RepID=A0A8H6S7K7_MYCCL|nr:hypothetical protein HMN09_01160300 [Mycena chlorophos]